MYKFSVQFFVYFMHLSCKFNTLRGSDGCNEGWAYLFRQGPCRVGNTLKLECVSLVYNMERREGSPTMDDCCTCLFILEGTSNHAAVIHEGCIPLHWVMSIYEKMKCRSFQYQGAVIGNVRFGMPVALKFVFFMYKLIVHLCTQEKF